MYNIGGNIVKEYEVAAFNGVEVQMNTILRGYGQ